MPSTAELPRKRSLFDISDDLMALGDLMATAIDEATGELLPEAQAQIESWFAELEQDRDAKVDNYAALIREFEARADMRKAEAKRMQDLAKSDQSHADRLKARLQEFFEQQGIDKIETPRFRVMVQAHGGKLPVIVDVDPKTLPPTLQKVSIDVDKEAVRARLEAGETIDGCRFGERGRSLRIK